MHWKPGLVFLAAAILPACGGGDDGPTDPGNGDGTSVSVRNNLFAPATLQVPVNGTVTWTWSSSGVEHNVTFQSGPSSATQGSGSFSRSFASAGQFSYVCTIHAAQGMTGVINVTAGSGSEGGGGNEGGGDGGGGGGYGP